MNGGSVRVFLPDLRAVERGLPVPVPERIRILREMEFDLEALSAQLMAEGMPAEEARARALDALVPDSASLLALGRLHGPLYQRVAKHLGYRRLKAIEGLALGLAAASTLVVQTMALVQTDLLRDPSPFLWPVLGLGGVLLTAIVATAMVLWVMGDHRIAAHGLRVIMILAGGILAAGIGGTGTGLYRLAGLLEKDPGLAGRLVPLWLVRDCELVAVALLLALAGGLAWFALTQWVAWISEAHRDVLGLDA